MRPTRLIALLVLVLALPCAAQVPGGERLALVIGNATYKEAPLANPAHDAADVAKALEASGFKVIRRENASLKEMHLALREFGDRLTRTSTGLVYFAGHGLQVRGRNFLVPVDADIAREDEVAFAALDLAAVIEKMDSARNAVNIVILDACRNSPFGARVPVAAKGLAQVEAPPGTIIAFATAPGSVAADGTGRNGLYTHHLLAEMRKPGAAIEEVFRGVRAAVRRDSQGRQIPWESTSLESAFSFVDAPRQVAAAVPANPAPKGTSVPRSAPTSIAAPPAYAKGDRWTYRATNLLNDTYREYTNVVRDIVGDEVVFTNGATVDLLGNPIVSYLPSGAANVHRPTSHFYVFPLKAGDVRKDLAFEQHLENRIYDAVTTIKVIGEEEVETPAGKMRAIRIERSTQWKQRGADYAGSNLYTYWYNAAVKRWVMLESKNTTSKGKVIQHERIVLTAWQVN